MLDQTILSKIKYIKLQTRRRLSSLQVGQYRSSHKGQGIEFDQIRDYELGDDIRCIDWNSSARMQKLLVKQYIHEYNKTILICLDISFSTEYGSSCATKKSILAQVATVLALAGECDNAQVGLVLFSDVIEEFIPPKSGASHIRFILEKIWKAQPKRKGTRLKSVLELLGLIKRKDSITFILSDFIDSDNFIKDLGLMSKKYELIAIRCLDYYEKNLALGCFIHSVDAETGLPLLLDTRDLKNLDGFLKNRMMHQEKEFKKVGVAMLDIDPQQEFMNNLIDFCAKRLSY